MVFGLITILAMFVLVLLPSIQLNEFITVPGPVQEADEIPETDHNGGRIDVGMETEPFGLFQVGIDEEVNMVARIINQSEWGHRPGC